MAGILTQNLVLQKTKLDNMKHVRKLNVCGVHCNDIGVLRDARNVEVLSLSVNDIEELDALSELSQLRELYLRKNCIRDLHQVLHLAKLPMLSWLNMSENPVSGDPHYRKFVIAALPSLARLDDVDVDSVEREDAERVFPDVHQMAPPPVGASLGSPSRPFTTPRGAQRQQQPVQQGSVRASAALAQRFEELTSAFDDIPVGGRRNHHQKRGSPPDSQRHQYAAASTHHRSAAPVAPAGPREEAVVMAVKTLLNELSPAAISEVRQFIDSMRI